MSRILAQANALDALTRWLLIYVLWFSYFHLKMSFQTALLKLRVVPFHAHKLNIWVSISRRRKKKCNLCHCEYANQSNMTMRFVLSYFIFIRYDKARTQVADAAFQKERKNTQMFLFAGDKKKQNAPSLYVMLPSISTWTFWRLQI